MSKNNRKEIIRKMTDQRQRFSLRKYGIGVASVLIGLTFLGGYSVTAHADAPEANAAANVQVQSAGVSTASSASSSATSTTTSASSAVQSSAKASASSASAESSATSSASSANSASSGANNSVIASSANRVQPVTPAATSTETTTSPASASQFNTADWNYTTNTDGSGITITGRKSTAAATTDYYIPNTADFRKAGIISANQRAYIKRENLSSIVANATSIVIDPDHSDEKGFGLVVIPSDDRGSDGNVTFVNSISHMFMNLPNLKTANVGGLDVSEVQNMHGLFQNDPELTSVTGLDTWNVAQNENIGHMFANDSKLKTVEGLNGWNTSSLKYMDNMFLNDAALTSIGDISGWNTNNVVLTQHMFDGASSLTTVGDLSNWRLPNVINTSYMFANASSLQNLGNLDNWGMGKDTTLDHMFYYDLALTNIGNLGNWDVSNVTTTKQMFDACLNLPSVGDLSSWNTSKVTDMGQMFRVNYTEKNNTFLGTPITINGQTINNSRLYSGKLSEIGDLSNWDTSNVTDMAGMFEGVTASTLGDLTKWNTNKVTNMDYMFQATPNLKSIGNGDLTGWDQDGKLEVTYNMFEGSGITSLNVSNWKLHVPSGRTPSGRDNEGITASARVGKMFNDLVNPATITMNGWDSNFTTSDFNGPQPLIILSNTISTDLNNQAVTTDWNQTAGVGHPANTVTFVDASKVTTPVASQQQDFVFKDNVSLEAALNKIPTDDNWSNLTVNGTSSTLGTLAKANSGAYLNGKHNATGTEYSGDYGKIAGTYSVQGDTEDVTNTEKKGYVSSTYQVIEHLPSGAKKLIDQTISGYKTATKNRLTGDVTYGDYRVGNLNIVNRGTIPESTTDPNVTPMNDSTFVQNYKVDVVPGYTITADPVSYNSTEADDRGNSYRVLNYSYNNTNKSFTYDFIVGTQAGSQDVTFAALPASKTFNINYAADTSATIKYVDTDDNDRVVTTGTLNGAVGQDKTLSNSDFTIPENYELATGYTLPTSYTFTSAKDQVITVKLQHKTEDVTKSDENQTKTTATYKIVEKRPASYGGDEVLLNQTVTAYKKAIKDLVTGKITYGDNHVSYADSGSVPYVMSNVVIDNSGTPAGTFSANDPTTAYNIKYDNSFPGYVTHKFDDYLSTELGTNPNVQGGSGYQVLKVVFGTNDGKSVINYDFMVGGNLNTPTFNALPSSREFDITYTPDTVTVEPTDPKTTNDPLPEGKTTDPNYPNGHNYPSGVATNDLNRTVKRTINITKPDGSTTQVVQKTTFTRKGTVNLVTGAVTYSDWTMSGNNGWTEYDVADIDGYTPSQDDVPAETPSADTQDETVNISYAANYQTGKISYVDSEGHEIATTELSGSTGDTVDINPVAPAGWKIVPGQNIPTTVTAGASGIPTVKVEIEHITTTVQPTDPKTPNDPLPDNPTHNYPRGVAHDDLNKTVTRTINVIKPDGTTTTVTQTATLSRTATVDEVTGEVTYGDWTIDTNNWKEYDVPAVDGYTPTQSSVSAVNTVAGLLSDKTVNISYVPNDQAGYIKYVDDSGKVISTSILTGKTGDTINVTPVAPAGWKIVPGQNIPTTVTAGPDGVPSVTVKIEHITTTVQPTDPKTPNDPLPDNPNMNYPKGVAHDDLNKTVTRTIKVVKPDGTTETIEQTAQLSRIATVDEVTGEVTYGAWKVDENGWVSYAAPEIAGYTPTISEVAAGDPLNGDVTITISYTKNATPTPTPEPNNSNHGTGSDTSNSSSTVGHINTPTSQGRSETTSSVSSTAGEIKTVAGQKLSTSNVKTGSNSQQAKKLPQTGNDHSDVSALGLAVAALAGFLGLTDNRDRKQD